MCLQSFVDPVVRVGDPFDLFFFFEPESDFAVGGIDRVRTVADVSSDLNAEVTSDGSGERSQRVGLTEEGTSSLDNPFSFPDHSNNWA